jgi:hypothetical protein
MPSDLLERSECLASEPAGRKNLTDLANQFGSDKGTVVGNPPHRYSYLYDLLFAPCRDQPIRFLEMGLAIGGPELGGQVDRRVESPSIRMWLEYFPQAHIFGFDISDFSHMADPRFTFIRGDSGSEADLRRLGEASPEYDIIIDDASHASYHQQLALKLMYPRLAEGGLYIIEDLQWQPPLFETILPKVPKTAEFLNGYFESGHYIQNALFPEEAMAGLKASCASFSAFPAFGRETSFRQVARSEARTKLIILRKQSQPAA